MATIHPRFRVLAACAVAAVAAATLASCAGDRAPETVSAQNPSVTYKYRGDQELLRANQQAAAFCNQYGTTPRTVNLTNNPDGTNTVIFECVKVGAPTTAMAPVAPLPPTNPALTYTYRTERELLDSSRRADAYCMQYGQRMVATSSIVTNADGSRTATFQCGPTIAVVP
jgi:hypothetical protein